MTLRRWQMIAILVVVAMAAGAIGVASQQTELNDLRDKNTALAHDNAALRNKNTALVHDTVALQDENAVLAHDRAALRAENAGLQEKFDVFGLPHGDVPVSETSFRIAMPTRLRAGRHTIALTNNGEGHELLLFRTDLGAAALPVNTIGDVIEDSPMLHKVLDSGGSPEANQSLPVTLDPGHYVAICNVPGHYLSGMRLDITVSQ